MKVEEAFPAFLPREVFKDYPSILSFVIECKVPLSALNHFIRKSYSKHFLSYGNTCMVSVISEKTEQYFNAIFSLMGYMTYLQEAEF